MVHTVLVLKPYKYAGYPMLITTIERESGDDDLFSKSAPILTAASELAFHTMNNSALNAEELRRENGIPVSGALWMCNYAFICGLCRTCRYCRQLLLAVSVSLLLLVKKQTWPPR